MLARQMAASILSLGPSHLSLSSSFLPLSRLACTICGSWVDERGGMERDWKTVLLSHSNWGKNLAYVLMHALPPPLPSFSLSHCFSIKPAPCFSFCRPLCVFFSSCCLILIPGVVLLLQLSYFCFSVIVYICIVIASTTIY